jgi:hypothetical protein
MKRVVKSVDIPSGRYHNVTTFDVASLKAATPKLKKELRVRAETLLAEALGQENEYIVLNIEGMPPAMTKLAWVRYTGALKAVVAACTVPAKDPLLQ